MQGVRAARTRWRRAIGPPGPAHLAAGLWGEAQAEQHLRAKGYHILGRRVRLGRRDELDLVARAGDALVFVEVKTRSAAGLARPAAAVNHAKRRTLARAAARYLARLGPRRPHHYRFDVVEVIGHADGPVPEIKHIESAFQITRYCRLPW